MHFVADFGFDPRNSLQLSSFVTTPSLVSVRRQFFHWLLTSSLIPLVISPVLAVLVVSAVWPLFQLLALFPLWPVFQLLLSSANPLLSTSFASAFLDMELIAVAVCATVVAAADALPPGLNSMMQHSTVIP